MKWENGVLEERPQSRHEEVVNSALHSLGAILALGGGYTLVHTAWENDNTLRLLCGLVFAGAMIIVYATSAFYHASERGPKKDHLQRIDRAAISLFFAGTYTPIALLMVRGWLGTLLCIGEWLLAFTGMVLMVQDPQSYPKRSTWLYQGMGWLTALGAGPLLRHAPATILTALALGGLCYTIGILFLTRDRVKYFHAIFHVLAMLGTALQFWAISQYVG